MRNIQTTATAIASAIRACNGGRISQEAARAAMESLTKVSAPDELVDNLATLLNLSALNQELERCGLVKTERTLSALMAAVKAALAE